MRFSLTREALLKPVQQVVGVVEKRQTMPVLSNLLVSLQGGTLSITASDLEVEMVGRVACADGEEGAITIPARKLFEILRALPDGVMVTVSVAGERISVNAGRSRYTLAGLAAEEYPSADETEVVERLRVPEESLRKAFEATAFAMAQQDVRFYLNGLLLDAEGSTLRCVATDGHRLALSEAELLEPAQVKRQLIVPRKGVLELLRLLESSDRPVELEVGRSHMRVRRDDVSFSSKLIDGRFPDYEAVIPLGADKEVRVDRDLLRSALQRAVILSNEKYRGVRLEVEPSVLRVVAHNPEQEEAVEDVEAETAISGLSIGFNASYLLEALGALTEAQAVLLFRDSASSALVREASHARSRHVVMPMRL
jgi:DNA polymerase III subunit beta